MIASVPVTTILLPLLLVGAPASAASSSSAAPDDGPIRLLVSGLESSDPAAVDLAYRIEENLAKAFLADPSVAVMRVDDVPDFPEYSARIYLDTCPLGHIVDCSRVAGDRGKAAFAVTATVTPVEGGTRLYVYVLDIAGGQPIEGFPYDLVSGGEKALSTNVVQKIQTHIAQSKIVPTTIIKAENKVEWDPDTSKVAKAKHAAELADLSGDLNKAKEIVAETTDVGDGPGELARPTREGRSGGHQQQILLRADGGWWRGPVDAAYYHRYAYFEGEVVDAYSAQVARVTHTVQVGGEVAYGILPTLDVGIALGWAPGHLDTDVASQGEVVGAVPKTSAGRTVLWGGPRVEAALFPESWFHPAFGAGVTFVPTPDVENFATPGDTWEIFPGGMLLYATAWPGAQARLANRLDVFVRVPVDVRVAGPAFQDARTKTSALLELDAPDSNATLGIGAIAGLQVRFLGKD